MSPQDVMEQQRQAMAFCDRVLGDQWRSLSPLAIKTKIEAHLAAALAASAAKADNERLRGHQESDAEWVAEYAKVRDERDAFKGAFQIMFNCHHGDETTCGCREHARSLIASPEARATGETT